MFQNEVLPIRVLPNCRMTLTQREAKSDRRSVGSDSKDFASIISDDRSYFAVGIMATLTHFIA